MNRFDQRDVVGTAAGEQDVVGIVIPNDGGDTAADCGNGRCREVGAGEPILVHDDPCFRLIACAQRPTRRSLVVEDGTQGRGRPGVGPS